jgi:hypothetical protein
VPYRIAADAVVVLHAAFVCFVVLGGLFCLKWRGGVLLHLPAAAWGVWIEWSGGTCPLTPLEIRLRRLGGAAGYHGGFVQHYLLPLLYPDDLSRGVQIALGALVVLVNLAIYTAVARRWRRRGNSAADTRIP